MGKKKEKCVVCGNTAHWKTKKKGLYPLLCEKHLTEQKDYSEIFDYYDYIGD